MNLIQLTKTSPAEITEGQRAFLETHNAIMRAGRIITESLTGLAVNLKTMHDDKLYIEAGYESFEDYSENAVGIKRSQAYNYIKVIETLGIEFVQSTGQTIGITKLELLARLTDEERGEVVTSNKVEDITVRDLKEKIKKLEREKREALEDAADNESAFRRVENELAQAQTRLEELKDMPAPTSNAADEELQKQISTLQAEINTLKSKPLEKEIVKVKDEKTAAELAKAEKEIESNKIALRERERLLSEKQSELIKIRKQLEIAGDKNLVKFSIKFDELRALLNEVGECLSALDADKQEKCKAALKALLEGVL